MFQTWIKNTEREKMIENIIGIVLMIIQVEKYFNPMYDIFLPPFLLLEQPLSNYS